MMDEMDEKRGMVKMLLDMLKSSAAKEVSDGMPKDGKGLEIEKVSVMPHDMDKSEPMSPASLVAHEMEEHGHMPSEEEEEHEDMNKGGEVAKLDPPKEMPTPIEEDDTEEMSSSPFASFLGKKKKK